MSEKKYRFMTIRQDGTELFEGHPVFRIYNNKSGAQLGILSYYEPWKQYVFSSQPDCVFNDGCLRDVLDFVGTVCAAEVAANRPMTPALRTWARSQRRTVHP